jgi:hypothetical protein
VLLRIARPFVFQASLGNFQLLVMRLKLLLETPDGFLRVLLHRV